VTAGDLKWAVAVLAGVVLGIVVLGGGDDWSGLIGAVAGVLAVVVVRVVRRRRRPPE